VGVNCETRALFEYWDFYTRNVDETWDFLNWLAQDTYDFHISCANFYNPLFCIPDLAPFGVKLATVLIMIAHLVPIIFLMRVLRDLAI